MSLEAFVWTLALLAALLAFVCVFYGNTQED